MNIQEIRFRVPVALLLALVLGAGLPLSSDARPVETSPTEKEPGHEQTWLTRVDDALTEARASDRLILVDLYADWCGWCKKLERNVFTHPRFQSFARQFVLLRLDVMDGGEGSDLQARYEAFSLPTTLILDAAKVQVGAVAGYADVDPYIGYIQSEVSRWQRDLQRYDRLMESRDPKLLLTVARELHQRGDGQRASKVYRKLLDEGHAERGTADPQWLHYVLADALRLGGRLADAAREARESRRLAQRVDDRQVLEAVDLLAVQIARDRDDCLATETALKTFLDNHPRSTHRKQARQSLDSLGSCT